MKRTLGGAALALAFVFGIIATTGTAANAQWRNGNNGYNQQQLQQGYQFGVTTGSSDAQRRQSYGPQRSHYYREARTQAFRDGFVRGYDRGFSQYSASAGYGYGYPNGGNRNDGYYPRDGYNNQELSRGYQQGINTGASDGQSNKNYGPERSRYFKNASTQAFRDGFVRGYDEGYRQYARNGNYRRSNAAATILEQIFRNP